MAQTFFGIYAATVLNVRDGRVQVMIPSVGVPMTGWARACLSPGASASAVNVGNNGWVMFEAGNPMYPVFMGVSPT